MVRLARVASLFILASLLLALPALAQTTTVQVPFGDWVGAVVPFLGVLVLALLGTGIALVLPHLPAWAQGLATAQLQAQLTAAVAFAVEWAVQDVSEAAKGKTLTIDVGNELLAKGAQKAIDVLPGKVVEWAGGAEGIKEQVLAHFENANVILPEASAAKDRMAAPAVRAVSANP